MAQQSLLDETAAQLVPERPTLRRLREAAAGCKACPLWKTGTQTVFGEGSPKAEVMFVGEQPGDQEDKAGRPFVGPAGKLLDKAMAEAGIDRSLAYVTNVVKHFKWQARGKRRIHQKPNWSEIAACFPWLEAELAVVKPRVLVCLGATAAQALLGRQFRVSRQRCEASARETRVHSLAACASAEVVCRSTIAGASWMSSSFSRASTMNEAKSTRRVRLLARMGSPTSKPLRRWRWARCRAGTLTTSTSTSTSASLTTARSNVGFPTRALSDPSGKALWAVVLSTLGHTGRVRQQR
jgi:uracil-DNA glycosylase family protein